MSGFPRFLLVYFILGALAGCTDRQHRNPLDPLTTSPAGEFSGLVAVAGDGEIVLRWDYSHFDDVEGYRLYRRVEGQGLVAHPPESLPPAATRWVDAAVENGTTYEYRLALLVRGEGEHLLEDVRRATPGEQVCWVGDAFTGIVWQISPDGRTEHFGRGRFADLAGMALYLADGSCWVSDPRSWGLGRIRADGELEPRVAALGAPAALSIDSEHGIGWVVDREHREVAWFSVAAATDTLSLARVDAHFVQPDGVSARDDHCWIADRGAGRVLLVARDGQRRVEFSGLPQPGPIAAASADVAWLLLGNGDRLVRLDAARGRVDEVALPFAAPVRALDVAVESQACWVLGDGDLAVFGPDGMLLEHSTVAGLPSGRRGLALDEAHRQVWIGAPSVLCKYSMDGELLAKLEGFSKPSLVLVDAGAF